MSQQLIAFKTGTFKSFDGTKIYYETHGEGEPLVLCYGIGCLINHWRHQIKHFSRTHKVIVFDYRAHHKSEPPQSRENLSIDALAKDVSCLARHLEIQKFSLWGHSFGGQVAIRLYDISPDLVSSIILINGFVKNPLAGMFGNDISTTLFRLIHNSYLKLPQTLSYLWRTGVNNSIAIQLSALLGGFNLNLTSLKDAEIYARGIANIDLESFLSLFESMTLYDGSSVLDKINVPSLIIGGNQDSITPLGHQKEIHQKITGSEFLMVPYGSHCTQLDMPELVNLKIESFLGQSRS